MRFVMSQLSVMAAYDFLSILIMESLENESREQHHPYKLLH